MGVSQKEGKMEGWLYLIRSNRLGLQNSRKRYFILDDNRLDCYKMATVSKKEDPIRSVEIDSFMRVTDDGRETIHRKLGATSSEEAAKWIRSFNEAALKECADQQDNILACSKRKWHSLRLSRGKRSSRLNSLDLVDWTVCSSGHANPITADVLAPSPWAIFGCQNGLRLFKEAKDGDFHGKDWDDHPAIMAVGVVDATSEAIFQTIMSLGPSRSEWDFCFSRGSLVEHLDGHTDIIHKQLNSDWMPWGMARRDLLLRRYWRREDDGTYVILYHSVYHKKCRPRTGYIRACLKSGGYVISPVSQGKQSVVKHMLAIDWKFWKSYVLSSSAKSTTIRMLGRIAALREFFKAKLGNYPCSNFSSGELTKEIELPQSEKEQIKVEVQPMAESPKSEVLTEEEVQKSPTKVARLSGPFLQLSDAADEFFDVASENDQSDDSWSSDTGQEMQSQDPCYPKLPTASDIVKKLHDLAAQKRGQMDLQEAEVEDSMSCSYGTTLSKDPSCTSACSWMTADPSTFLIRGKNYLRDNQKVKANGTLMQMVAADWLRSDKREDNLGGRPGSIVQKYAAQGGNEFFFVVNIQVPGVTAYNLALYYMLDAPIESIPLLDNFVKGDDAFRNSRFKLIPYISQGSWIVKQSVGKKACLVGQALELNYIHGTNYLEVGIDVGSSTVARGVVSLVLGYLTNLVIELAFVVQANTQEELPECLLGTCRLNHLDASEAFLVKQ
ncbi:protein ENHANCED DISEASE RESISTANCE 2-like isoform X2 [Magnolia sinica]|uniref:protein ENHANCED DISEASE RESISTANCE 2-like isoform X2 n=1 Tax=Magnolia sinica TaxID=86752 RepID=UPI00265A9866|nr:protein ENHANCED DISEASE RESISTANCE 2-like isoform X2 [Magnolia sinica]